MLVANISVKSNCYYTQHLHTRSGMFPFEDPTMRDPTITAWQRFQSTLLRAGSGWTAPQENWATLPPAFRGQNIPMQPVGGQQAARDPTLHPDQNANQGQGMPTHQQAADQLNQNQANEIRPPSKGWCQTWIIDHPKVWTVILIITLLVIIGILSHTINSTKSKTVGVMEQGSQDMNEKPHQANTWPGRV